MRPLPTRPRLRPERTAGALLLLVALAAPVRADLVVHRLVRADELSRPDRSGGGELCPAPVERPRSGERVTLSVAANRARRDEALVSFIVDLEAGRAWIVDHRARSYSEFAFPVPTRELANRMRASLGAEGDQRFPYRLLGSVYESVADRDGAARTTRAARVGNGFGSELEVEVEIQPDAALGRAALAVEAFALAVRGAGESWLGTLAPPDGIPLGLVAELQQRRDPVRYREAAATAEPATLDAALFAPPPGYARVAHQPDCF